MCYTLSGNDAINKVGEKCGQGLEKEKNPWSNLLILNIEISFLIGLYLYLSSRNNLKTVLITFKFKFVVW